MKDMKYERSDNLLFSMTGLNMINEQDEFDIDEGMELGENIKKGIISRGFGNKLNLKMRDSDFKHLQIYLSTHDSWRTKLDSKSYEK